MEQFVRIAALLALSGAAVAQSATPAEQPQAAEVIATNPSEPAATEPPPSSVPWKLEIHPCVWYMGVSGDITLPRTGGGSSSVSINDLDLTSPHLTPYGEATLRKGRWLVGLRGFAFSTEQDATVDITADLGNTDLTPGTAVQSSLDLSAVEVEGGYTLVLAERSPLTGGGYKLRTRVDALAGIRLMNLGFDTAVLPAIATDPLESQQSVSEFTAQPLVGARVTADIYEEFTITLEVSIGAQPFGDDSSYGLDIIVGGQWRPTEHVGLQIGYRSLFLGMSSGSGDNEFEFTGAAQGLYAGVTFSF